MIKLYITGISGLLGGNLAYLLRDKYIVAGVARSKIAIPQVRSASFNLLDSNKLHSNINEFSPDVIIHTAAEVGVDYCEGHKERAYQLNTELTKTISEICLEKGIRLIYISTDSVFDGTKRGLYKEHDETNPINIYAKTKLEGEHYVSRLPNSTVIRTNIYGCSIMPGRVSIGEWIYNSLSEGQTLHLFENVFFSPILVNELSAIISLIIKKETFGLFHIGSTESISKYNFGIELKRIFEIETGTIIKSHSSKSDKILASRPNNMGLDNTKIKETLNIDISTPSQSLNRFKELYMSRYPDTLKEVYKGAPDAF